VGIGFKRGIGFFEKSDFFVLGRCEVVAAVRLLGSESCGVLRVEVMILNEGVVGVVFEISLWIMVAIFF